MVAVNLPGQMSLPLGMRLNNPFNLQQEHIDWVGLGAQQLPSGELQFTDLIDGIRAGVLLCYTYQRRGLNTIDTFIPLFAPAKSGNPTAQYIANVCRWTGFAPHQPLDFHDPDVLCKFAISIFRQEQGADNGITTDQVRQAIELADGGLE